MVPSSACVPRDISHLPERFGLFTIQVFGESIAAKVAGLGLIEWEVESAQSTFVHGRLNRLSDPFRVGH
jgi:low temperature requirement protein LtrA